MENDLTEQEISLIKKIGLKLVDKKPLENEMYIHFKENNNYESNFNFNFVPQEHVSFSMRGSTEKLSPNQLEKLIYNLIHDYSKTVDFNKPIKIYSEDKKQDEYVKTLMEKYL